MSDVVKKAQDASARIARKTTAGHVASSRDSESRRGATLDPVANALDDMTCEPAYCVPQNASDSRNVGSDFEPEVTNDYTRGIEYDYTRDQDLYQDSELDADEPLYRSNDAHPYRNDRVS